MEVYPKIHAPFKRFTTGPEKGKLITGEWAQPEFAYLADNEWEYSEKVDGTNIRIYLQRVDDCLMVTYRGRTDNADIPLPLMEHLEEVFPTEWLWRRDVSRPAFFERRDVVHQWMVDNDLTEVTLYGEGYGPKIQNGGKYRPDASFVLFDVKIGNWWLSRDNVNDVADKLGIESVPVLGTGSLWQIFTLVRTGKTRDLAGNTIDPSLNGRLKSQWGDFEAEGVVCRPVVPLFNNKGERITTKVKAVDFR